MRLRWMLSLRRPELPTSPDLCDGFLSFLLWILVEGMRLLTDKGKETNGKMRPQETHDTMGEVQCGLGSQLCYLLAV